MRLRIGYPSQEIEREVLRRRRGVDPIDALEPVVDKAELLAAQQAVEHVRVAEELIDYLHQLVLATRNTPHLSIGASTRAALALEQAVRGRALVAGRAYAIPDDLKAVAVPVLAHRVRAAGLRDGAGGGDTEPVIRELLANIPVPV
jgi:MoxR-like ATPase